MEHLMIPSFTTVYCLLHSIVFYFRQTASVKHVRIYFSLSQMSIQLLFSAEMVSHILY